MQSVQIDPQAPELTREVYVARQPIFSPDKSLYAYELLYRSSLNNAFDGEDSTVATSRVIANTYFTIGLDRLVGNRRAFINFDRRMLVEGFAEMLPSKSLVIEILEAVEPDEEVLQACRRVKKRGYMLALDDFVLMDGYAGLLQLADIVKVDFRLVRPETHGSLAGELKKFDLQLLAEKVETEEEFQRAGYLGYTLFQGFFFSKPQIITGKHLPAYKQNYMRVLREVTRPEPNLDEVLKAMKTETSLVHQFLRYINSPLFALTREVRSLRQALAMLGWKRVRRWVSLAILSGLAASKPQQLLVNAFVRATFCESLGPLLGWEDRDSDLFLLGMYSLVDAVLDRPTDEVIEGVHLPEDIRSALLDEPSHTPIPGKVLALARGYERAEWDAVEESAAALHISPDETARRYRKAVEAADEIFSFV